MELLIDGVKYKLWIPEDEKALEEEVKEHFKDIFGENSLYFDLKPELRSKAGIGSKPDGIVVVFDKPCFYVVEIERGEHGVHDHIVTQISKFNTALKSPETKMKIAETIYGEINADPFKQVFVKSRVKGEIHKFLTDLISSKPIVVIMIDEMLDELKEATEELPLQFEILEFKTFEREGVGLKVHAHLYKPLVSPKISVAEPSEAELESLFPDFIKSIYPDYNSNWHSAALLTVLNEKHKGKANAVHSWNLAKDMMDRFPSLFIGKTQKDVSFGNVFAGTFLKRKGLIKFVMQKTPEGYEYRKYWV